MFRTRLISFLFATAALFVGVTAASAQGTQPTHGQVVLQKADGTKTPVADAVVEAYRTDIDRGKMPSAKTNKKGEFTFAGMVPGQRYVIAVSAPGIGPRVQPDVKAGMDNVTITVTEGDGKVLTEAEVRGVVAQAATTPGTNLSAEERAKQAELAKKNEEIMRKNEQLKAGDAVAASSLKEGSAALTAKNYDLAIQKFGEGVAAVPDFIGSTPVNLNGLIVAHRLKGFDIYKEGAANTDIAARKAKYELANKEYNAALEAFDKAVTIIKNAEATTDAAEQKRRENLKLELYSNATEVHRLKAAGQVDVTMGDRAEAVITEYIAMQTDPAKKVASKVTLGDVMRETGNFDKAIAAYRAVLEASPDNLDATAQLGLTLVATSLEPPDKNKLQEGLNYMQKFADAAPETHRYKADVKQMVEYLKSEQKLTPQKVTTNRKKT